MERVASAGHLLVATHGLRAVRLLRQEAAGATGRAGTRPVEIVRCRRVLGIYWLWQLRFLARLGRLQRGVGWASALPARLVRHQCLIVLLLWLSPIADSLAPLGQEVVHLGRAHRN